MHAGTRNHASQAQEAHAQSHASFLRQFAQASANWPRTGASVPADIHTIFIE